MLMQQQALLLDVRCGAWLVVLLNALIMSQAPATTGLRKQRMAYYAMSSVQL